VVPYLHLPMVPYWAMLGLGLLTGTFSNGDQPKRLQCHDERECDAFC
jgi:hypothetical protein